MGKNMIQQVFVKSLDCILYLEDFLSYLFKFNDVRVSNSSWSKPIMYNYVQLFH